MRLSTPREHDELTVNRFDGHHKRGSDGGSRAIMPINQLKLDVNSLEKQGSAPNIKQRFGKNYRSGDNFGPIEYKAQSSLEVPSKLGVGQHLSSATSITGGGESVVSNIQVNDFGEVQHMGQNYDRPSLSVLNGMVPRNLNLPNEKNTPLSGARHGYSALRTQRRQTQGTPMPGNMVRAKFDLQTADSGNLAKNMPYANSLKIVDTNSILSA